MNRSALHQLVIGLKHDAKLRNVYARQITGHIKFFLRVFLRRFFTGAFGPNSLISARFGADIWAQKNPAFSNALLCKH
ncbi:hypothetical protein [Hymenobacter daeguensis]